MIFAECKRDGKYLSPEQFDWAEDIRSVLVEVIPERVAYVVWRPKDWRSIEEVLKGEAWPV